jgi:hypothetical protein
MILTVISACDSYMEAQKQVMIIGANFLLVEFGIILFCSGFQSG